MVSLKRAPSFRNKVVRANHSGHRTHQPTEPPEGKFYVANLINPSKRVTNNVSKRTCFIILILLQQFTILNV